ncbi:hypothetical protein ACQZ61_05060 [Agrobacterium vitis]|uniref:hypothetical protein n=1 Tax=Agrobacterium vitis TaxID=373 RepID=UPI0015D9D16C|nr:hypothetical protein [Agrobacterium vitis]MCF1454503.1 hypothetical protein [Agrobacterium vitis]BCH55552.1 hypothetical protein RvVAR031_31620 [Agrobacterium vitis]
MENTGTGISSISIYDPDKNNGGNRRINVEIPAILKHEGWSILLAPFQLSLSIIFLYIIYILNKIEIQSFTKSGYINFYAMIYILIFIYSFFAVIFYSISNTYVDFICKVPFLQIDEFGFTDRRISNEKIMWNNVFVKTITGGTWVRRTAMYVRIDAQNIKFHPWRLDVIVNRFLKINFIFIGFSRNEKENKKFIEVFKFFTRTKPYNEDQNVSKAS